MLFANIDILDENLDYQKAQFVGVEGDAITYVGAQEPADVARFGERYDGSGKLLMSAFYNTHAHTPMTLLRGYAENQPLQQWLNETVWPFEGKMEGEKGHHYWGCMLSQAEMLRYGMVSYTDMYFVTDERCRATMEAGMKANHCDSATMCFVETDYDTLPVAELNKKLFAEYHNAGDGRVKVDMCVHGEYTTPQGMIERCVAEAKAHGAGLHVHMSETKAEHEECKERHNGMTPAQWFDSLGVFDVPTNAAHCTYVEPDDIALMASKGVSASLNPASNMKLASGFAPVQAMIDAGVNCTLGTDGMASNNTHNILQSAYLLACLQKGYALDPAIIAPKEVLQMLTVNGARAQGREDCGVLAVGKKADLVVFDIDTPWMCPVYDMPTNLIYSANGADVVLTMCDGAVLYKDGEYATIDIEKTKHEVVRCVGEVLEALQEG
ncbi:MAG: amidohydrolase [Eggerthellaceae bacterium]|nr:amidohydrolase [Eggerthellaceae bacterium]